MLKFKLSHCTGFIEVDPESIQGFTKISEDHCRLLVGTNLEDSNIIDVNTDYLTLIREVGVASFAGWKKVGSEEIK